MRRSGYLLKRLAFALATAFVAVTFNFVLFRMLPGDAVTNLARIPKATPELKAELTARFGLDQPMWKQYLLYLRNLFEGDLGISWVSRQPVVSELGEALRNTLLLVSVGTVAAIVLGVATGVVAAWWRGTFVEKGTTLTGMTFYSMPTQWLGLILILIFSTTLGWFPSGGMESTGLNAEELILGIEPSLWDRVSDMLSHIVLPASTLGLVLYGEYTLFTRSALLETMGEDYILTAKAKGLSSRRVLQKHALRNAMLPIATLVALSLGFIAAGSILVESVFSWPGVGLLTYEAIQNRDYPMLQAAFLVITLSVIFFNLLADLAYFALDPRITE
jgi:ABC-type dipeptide/oligopeptide/nickel transport system permease component